MNELAVTRYLLEIRSLALVLTSATAALPIAPDLDVMLRIGMPVCMQRKRPYLIGIGIIRREHRQQVISH